MMRYDVLVVSNDTDGLERTRERLGAAVGIPLSRIGLSGNGELAVKVIDDIVAGGGKVGVVIADLGMKSMSGLDLLRQIQSRQRPVPVILTGLPESISAAGEMISLGGAYAYFPKSGQIEVLTGLVHAALSGYAGK